MFWIALASQLSAPLPLNFTRWFTPEDMPAYVQQAAITRRVQIHVIVRTDGTLQGCSIEATSGDSGLDALTCELVHKRAKFQPARWVDGTPAYGIYRLPVVWAIGDPSEFSKMPPMGDFEATVNRLPKGVHSPAAVGVMLAAEADGHISSCGEISPLWRPPPPSAKAVSVLVPIACDQIAKVYKPIDVNDDAGKPVRSVQTASVVFMKP